MNIKNLSGANNIMNGLTPSQATQTIDKSIKSDSTHDKDANGQQAYQSQIWGKI